MKKLFFIVAILFASSFSFAQSDSNFVGMWKSYVKAGNKPNTTQTYMVFNSDGSFLWNIDSLESDPMKNSSGGRWSVTDEGEIKLVPADTLTAVRYYRPSGNNIYIYTCEEKNGKKVKVFMLEMDFYIEKISPDK